MTYEQKYLKYKNKYLNSKKNSVSDDLTYFLEIDIQYNIFNLLTVVSNNPTSMISNLLNSYEKISGKIDNNDLMNNIEYLNKLHSQLEKTSYNSLICKQQEITNSILDIPDVKKIMDELFEYSKNIAFYQEFDKLDPIQKMLIIKDCLYSDQDDDEINTSNIQELLGGARNRLKKAHTTKYKHRKSRKSSIFYRIMLFLMTMLTSIIPSQETITKKKDEIITDIVSVNKTIGENSLLSTPWSVLKNIYSQTKTIYTKSNTYVHTGSTGVINEDIVTSGTWFIVNMLILNKILKPLRTIMLLSDKNNNKSKLLFYFFITTIAIPQMINFGVLYFELNKYKFTDIGSMIKTLVEEPQVCGLEYTQQYCNATLSNQFEQQIQHISYMPQIVDNMINKTIDTVTSFTVDSAANLLIPMYLYSKVAEVFELENIGYIYNFSLDQTISSVIQNMLKQ